MLVKPIQFRPRAELGYPGLRPGPAWKKGIKKTPRNDGGLVTSVDKLTTLRNLIRNPKD